MPRDEDIVLEVGRFKVYIYDDNHGPPHVHVHCKDREVKIMLNDKLSVRRSRGTPMPQGDRYRAKAIVREHFDYLLAKWHETFEE